MNNKQKEMEKHEQIKQEHQETVTANGLKAVLWETMGDLRRGRIDANKANAVSKVSNAILQTVKLETEVARMLGGASVSLTEFAFKNSDKVITRVNKDGEALAYAALKQIEEPKGY